MVSENPYLKCAEAIVGRDEIYSALSPRPEHVFFKWRDQVYKGSMQRLFEEKPGIALFSKSKEPYDKELVETIRAIDDKNERPDVNVPDDIQMGDVFSMLYIDEEVRSLTPDEMEYFQKNKPKMVNIDIRL